MVSIRRKVTNYLSFSTWNTGLGASIKSVMICTLDPASVNTSAYPYDTDIIGSTFCASQFTRKQGLPSDFLITW